MLEEYGQRDVCMYTVPWYSEIFCSPKSRGEWRVCEIFDYFFHKTNSLHTLLEKIKCSRETEILHEIFHDTTRKSEICELIRVVS